MQKTNKRTKKKRKRLLEKQLKGKITKKNEKAKNINKQEKQ